MATTSTKLLSTASSRPACCCSFLPAPLPSSTQENFPTFSFHYYTGFPTSSARHSLDQSSTSRRLPSAYILPKPTRDPLSQTVASAIFCLLQVVFPQLTHLSDVQQLLRYLWQLFQNLDARQKMGFSLAFRKATLAWPRNSLGLACNWKPRVTE